MILRRLKANVEKENWFAVFLDFCIVVIGVFIGIQVANWNEARSEQARGESIKARLAAEFVDIEPQIARHVRNVTQYRDLADILAKDVLSRRRRSAIPGVCRSKSSDHWHAPTGGSNTIRSSLVREIWTYLGPLIRRWKNNTPFHGRGHFVPGSQ